MVIVGTWEEIGEGNFIFSINQSGFEQIADCEQSCLEKQQGGDHPGVPQPFPAEQPADELPDQPEQDAVEQHVQEGCEGVGEVFGA
jgi:hypothetical protein